mmetsp:Transcript_118545/g.187723  ORF Transcript_118545/g.187723 Transcript_118545/m.187723 type:complete len:493 (+) Transcript_118545:359-1837(+)
MFQFDQKELQKDVNHEESQTSEAEVSTSIASESQHSPAADCALVGSSSQTTRVAKKKSRGLACAPSQGIARRSHCPILEGADRDSVRLAASLALDELGDPEEPILLVDLSRVSQKLAQWRRHLPRVIPHYSVKCNPDKHLLRRLQEGGCGFDCTSMEEIHRVLSIGAAPEDVVFSHPVKLRSHLRFAKTKNVPLMSFDNEAELRKIAAEFPAAKLLLHLAAEDASEQSSMSLKFGARRRDWASLLSVARDLGLNVVGASCHVGSRCEERGSLEKMLSDAADVFTLASERGFTMSMLDIGSSFPSDVLDSSAFEEFGTKLSEQLERRFPRGDFPSLRIIARPGRLFARSCANLLTKVLAKAEAKQSSDSRNDDCTEKNELTFWYHLNDGLYGSFNCVFYDQAVVTPELLLTATLERSDRLNRPCSIFGPTCEAFDVVMKEHVMPELQEGDWLLWRNMGAYTSASGSKVSGFPQPKVWYYDGAGLMANWNISER